MAEKIKVTKSTIIEGKIYHKDSTPEIGKEIHRKHANALLGMEHAEEHREPEPVKEPEKEPERPPQRQQQQQRPPEGGTPNAGQGGQQIQDKV